MGKTCTNAKRAPKFTPSEKLLLMSIISNKYASVIEDKKTDRTYVQDRIKSWKMVEEDFNSSLPNGVFRDWECLKRFYENQRKEVRKIKSNKRQELLRTGGGQVPPTKDDPADMLLLSIMNEKTVSGLKNKFDSDCNVTPVAIEVGDTLIFDMDTNDPECDVPSPVQCNAKKKT
ncbi:hypothetical protein PPYR_00334 [Photinus pyralis]|uniref:Regulatory protein zeste n=1 Tax=Photinus pyralis TaxID=7054 RepID=A0A5N4B1A2_PHOPY|nr:hypothetical protein PPYR_00334 [Photinus pyralis]